MNVKIFTAAAFANPGKPGAPKAEDRVTPVFGEVRTDLEIPATAKRGARSELAEKLATLPVGGSIGIANKTKKQISSAISKMNNAEENMKVTTITGEPIKDANGAVVATGPEKTIKERIKEFKAVDTDPKKDPDKATVRVFRVK